MRTHLSLRRLAVLCLAMSLVSAATAGAQEKAKADEVAIPLSKVVMFSSGVAFYEHAGAVDGQATLDLKFRTESINDLLKSMVLQDLGGGKISTVTYSSRDPVEKTLGTFAINLNGNPTLGQLLVQVRGEEVEVSAPNKITGTIISLERKQIATGDDKVLDIEVLNLLTADGLRSIPIDKIGLIRLTNARLDGELRQALATLALGHADDKKTVSLNFTGQGERKVRVGYIQEAPIWKTSYRLVLSEDKPFLQGWAIVENTTELDWKDVGLTLVSGRPISFRMDLYQPLYVDRPLVQPELYASLRPQTYDQDLVESDKEFKALQRKPQEGGPPAAKAAAAPPAPGFAARDANRGNARFDVTELERRQLDLQQGVASVAQAGDVGELFQYVIETPVTLPRRQSAMLPIVNGSVDGEKVGIYNIGVHAKHPLNGLQLKNSTGLHLLQGPVTVFDDGVYAGDARITDLSPGTTRLISYALDLDTEVAPEAKSLPDQLTQVKIVRGTLEAYTKYRRQQKYVIKNSGSKAKKLLIEQPFDSTWTLLAPKDPAEKTRDLYRFAVTAEPGKPVELIVEEERTGPRHYALTNTDDNTILFFSNSTVASPELKKALQEVIARKRAIAEVVARRQQAEQAIKIVEVEQARIRQNMAQLPREGDLYARYVKKFSEQEDLVEVQRQKIQQLQEEETKLRNALNGYLSGLTLS